MIISNPYCLITSPSPVDYVTSRWPGISLSRRVEIICETATCVAFFDGYPVSPGHALIVPKRHVSSYFDLTDHKAENGVDKSLTVLVIGCYVSLVLCSV